jgi:hypothetical protein
MPKPHLRLLPIPHPVVYIHNQLPRKTSPPSSLFFFFFFFFFLAQFHYPPPKKKKPIHLDV